MVSNWTNDDILIMNVTLKGLWIYAEKKRTSKETRKEIMPFQDEISTIGISYYFKFTIY